MTAIDNYDLTKEVLSGVEPVENTMSSPVVSTSSHYLPEDEKQHYLSSKSSLSSCRQSINDDDGGDVDQSAQVPPLSRKQTQASTMTTDPAFEIDWEENDPINPRDWPGWWKVIVLSFISWSTMIVVCNSTSYTAGIPGMDKSFGLDTDELAVLGVTTYLMGLALGSLVLAPLSEMFGRRPIYIVAMALFAIFVIPCGLAKSLETVLICRFFGALAGSAMIGNAPGSINDIISEEYRALAFSLWSIGPMNGPVIGPVIGGFIYQYLSWRWINWVILCGAGAAFIMMCLVPETYAPALLRQRAAKRRKETQDERWYSRYDEKKDFWPMLRIYLLRPLWMAVTEPICIFWNLYVAVVYGILYLCFVAYPIVFSELRGWSPGMTGLGYLGIGAGTLITIFTEPLLRRFINGKKPDQEGNRRPEAMVSVICIASILIPCGELIFAWTCTPNVPWIVPILAGVPFGTGCSMVFIYGSSYLVHSYGIYAASALAGNALLRSTLGATLPLAGVSMYRTLGPHWAGTLLAALEFILIPIPFVFYRYGDRIRRRSALIREMQEDKDRLEARRQRAEGRVQKLEQVGAPSKQVKEAVEEAVMIEKVEDVALQKEEEAKTMALGMGPQPFALAPGPADRPKLDA